MLKTIPYTLLLILIFSSLTTFAQGDLMIMPKRLVFDGSEKSQEINLANTGSDTAVYAVSFVNYIMTENGNFEQVEEPIEGQRFATDFLRYFPRRVSLAPNQAQTIRVQLTKTGNLKPGEYRSHMYFRAVEEQTALGSETNESSEGISINIKTVFGISIPIIIREGESNTIVKLTDLELIKQGEFPRLSLTLNRTGNMSVYGSLIANHVAIDGKKTEIGIVKGVSIYTPNTKRAFSFELREASKVDLNSGTLTVSYIEDKDEVLATSELSL